ncbi:MAG: DNA-processing protein DprA [Candidatus Gracilibacteria bacterium]|jgi:DNA processing protein|nr:DNA-processing protein DprA [Candidatus Gracilibacteria bacterium]
MENILIKNGDEYYPKILAEITNRPDSFYFRGDLEVLKKPKISVVGTRRPSAYGEYCCKKIVAELCEIPDICIVSGLAKGIDTIAHETALKCGAWNIAVLGSGINHIYPRQNKELSEKISKKGGIISEFSPEEGARDYYFPLRNRIISGISCATLAIEAPEESGTLITMKYALEQNRACFCVPSDIDRPSALGSLRLLQQSLAYPVSSGREIVTFLRENSGLFQEEIFSAGKKCERNFQDEKMDLVFSLLNFGRGKSVFEIQKKSELTVSDVLSVLSKLEIQGDIIFRAGLYFKN